MTNPAAKTRKRSSATQRPITSGGGRKRHVTKTTRRRPKGKGGPDQARSGRAGPTRAKPGTRKAGTRKAGRAKAARAKQRPPSHAGGRGESLFPGGSQPNRRFGIGVLLGILERGGDAGFLQLGRIEQFSVKPAQRPKTTLLAASEPADIAKILTGLAHTDRVRVARAVMTGANTHRLLSEAVGLKTGPLYHHVRELQRAGLLASVARNQYGLTPLGRTVLLVGTVLGSWGRKERPVWRTKRLRTAKRKSK